MIICSDPPYFEDEDSTLDVYCDCCGELLIQDAEDRPDSCVACDMLEHDVVRVKGSATDDVEEYCKECADKYNLKSFDEDEKMRFKIQDTYSAYHKRDYYTI